MRREPTTLPAALPGLLAATVLALAAGAASALPQVAIDVPGGDPAQDLTADGTFSGPNADGEWFWSLDESKEVESGQGSIDSWTLVAKDDRFVTNNLSLTNTTGTARVYVARVVLPGSGVAYGGITASSVGVSFSDADGDGSMTLAEDGGLSFYEAEVDGSAVVVLDPGTPLTAADCAPLPDREGCSATGSDGIGPIAASGTANDIAIALRFSLSPGDAVSITSRFEIVPEATLSQATPAAPGPGSGGGGGNGAAPGAASGVATPLGAVALADRHTITNDTSFTLAYLFSESLVVPSTDYDAAFSSSIGVTVTDSDGDGAIFFDENTVAIYRGRANSVTKLELDPGALSPADCAPIPSQPGCSATSSDNVDFLLVPAGTTDEIEIRTGFVLSPGDTAAFTARFALPEPAPPGSLAAGIALLALLAGRRR